MMTSTSFNMKSEYGDWVEPAPNPLPEILDSPKGFLSRYLVFKKPSYPTVIALWTAHTWVIQCFDYTPHLYISSPVKRCGKTRVFDCLGLLCAKPWRIVNATGAVLFRKIEKDCPSLLLDEVDTIFSANGKDDSKEGLRCVLNTGFERKATVPRCVGPQFELKEFHVFCPKAFAGIGKLPDTVADRSIEIAMVRKARNESAEKLRVHGVQTWPSFNNYMLRVRSCRKSLATAPQTLRATPGDCRDGRRSVADNGAIRSRGTVQRRRIRGKHWGPTLGRDP
jgi:hypothetical protein